MEIIMKKVGELIPYDKNAKKHDKKQIDNVANSIKRFGWQQPIVIDENNVVVIGHCRLMAAKKLGLNSVPVTVASGLTDLEIRELRIADNKTNESPWDLGLLDDDVEGLLFEGFDLGFGIKEFEANFVMHEAIENEEENVENEPVDAYKPEAFDKDLIEEYKEHENSFLAKKRIIITYAPEREHELCELIGVDPDHVKIVYDLSELIDK